MKIAIVTGSSGLIGSQTVKFLIEKDFNVIGIDNDMRSYFFGESASTKLTGKLLVSQYSNFTLHEIDIRNYWALEEIFSKHRDSIEMVVHTAAQPSHDWAAKEPLTDFSVNANGTMNLLELTRVYCPSATFIFTSTNKVYGDTPNSLNIIEKDTRYEAFDKNDEQELCEIEIDELMSIDHSKHSVFGASKVAADIMVQEYGKYFGMNTVVFRGGCLTGPDHAGAELHGFLSYLIKCIVHRKPYTIFGYKGKQVRDNIHSWDLVNMFWHYHNKPRPGEVYNAGGGRENSISILEAINLVNDKLKEIDNRDEWKDFSISDTNRIGDHIWYISDINKFKTHYPEWPGITISIKEIVQQIIKQNLENGLL